MRASFGVALAQKVTVKILKDSNPPARPFLSLLDALIQRSKVIRVPYIDDVSLLGTSPDKLNAVRDRVAEAFAYANLPTEPSKNVDAGDTPYNVAVGLAWWRDATVTVKPSHPQKLFKLTNTILSSKRASPKQI